jgi:DNA-binding beta-propeller fold protein YncE
MRKNVLTVTTIASIVSVATLAAGSVGASSQVPLGTIWVTERTPSGSTIAALDAATGASRGIAAVGDIPIGITAPPGLDKAYSSDEGADRMSVIDKRTVTVIGTIFTGTGTRPHHLMASRNGRLIYVGEYATNKVGIIDTRLDQKTAEYDASRNLLAKTHAVWITPNGKELYATNEGSPSAGPGTFSKLDARTGELIWEHPVGNRPSEVLVDGDTAYVSVRNDHVIRVYDVSGALPVFRGQAEAAFMPDTLSLTNDRRTLIVGLRGIPARMAFIDTRTLATEYLSLPGTTTGHQWLTPDARYTFIALEGAVGPPASPGMIALVDNRARDLVATYTYPNGKQRPHGLYFEPLEDDPAGS